MFVDRDLAGVGWRELLNSLALETPHACIILISRRIDSSLWTDVVQSGGYETIAKPMREEEIVRAVKMARNWSATVRK
jgi:FixJ family two-component response regulator